MTSELLCCPYCNSQITLSAAELDNPRVRCPRCGETFPHHHRPGGPPSANGLPEAAAGLAVQTAAPPQPGWSNRGVAVIILAGMVVVAVVALMFALRTVDFRRGNDIKGLPAGGVPPVAAGPVTTPPARLRALGYLPADVGIVAGLHLAEMLQDKEGKEFFKQLQERNVDLGLGLLEQKTGLKADDVDHLAVGVRATDSLPQVDLVVQTRRPYDPAALARVLAPTKPEKFEGRLVYRCQIGPLVSGLVYCVGERTLVLHVSMFAADLRDLKPIPVTPRPEAEALPAQVRALVQNQVDRQSFLWAAGSLKRFEALTDQLRTALKMPEEGQEVLAKLQAFGAGVHTQKGLTLEASLAVGDRKSALEVVQFLEKNAPQGVDSFKVVGPPEPKNAEEAGSSWVLVQVRGSPEQVAGVVHRFTTARKK